MNSVIVLKRLRMSRARLSLIALFIVASFAASAAFAQIDNANEKLGAWVKEALVHDQRVDAGELTVDANSGVITLSGILPTIAAKRFAVREAEKIDGVIAVVDETRVGAEKRDDVDIAADVKHRLENNASIQSKGLKVTCLDGVVTLSGEVSDYAEELEAGLVASETRGVSEVHNHLLTVFIGAETDQQVADEVAATLARDVYLSGLPLQVTVKRREVTISGKVGSAFEKSRIADEVHQIAQVKAVANQVAVDPSLAQGTRRSEPWPSDNDLEAAIASDLAHDARINAANIEISAEYGMVRLDGSVRTYREKRQAELDVRDVVGVVSVANNLTIDGPLCDDALLQTLITSELRSDAMLHRFEIIPRSTAGKVILQGHVDTAYEKTHAADVVGHVRGVIGIQNDLEVTREKLLSDEALDMVIKRRWSQNRQTKACGNEIKVEVLNGVAVLSGSVDTWSERKAAESVAYHTAGIWKVENRLIINGVDYPWEDWQQDFDSDFDPRYSPEHLFLFYV